MGKFCGQKNIGKKNFPHGGEIEAKKAQRELIKGFIRTLENTGNDAEEFDARMWCALVDHVTVTDKDNITFTFKNGLETKVS